MKRNSLLFYTGNIAIVFSLFGFLFTFYPIIQAYISPGQEITVEKMKQKKGLYIAIPKIHAQSPIIPNVDPWNENIYKEALKKGVAHAKGTSLPEEKGTIFLFAHSSGAPWEMTHTNTLFLRLGELGTGDKILIASNGKLLTYTVYDRKEIWPDEISYLKTKKDNELILQTCTPIGTSLKRLLVFAQRQ